MGSLKSVVSAVVLMLAAGAGAGEISSAVANKGAGGEIVSVTLSLAIGANETNFLYKAYGPVAGAADSTNGWASVEYVGTYTADATVTVPVPAGWEETVRDIRFLLAEGGTLLPKLTFLKTQTIGASQAAQQWTTTDLLPTDKTRMVLDYTYTISCPGFGLAGRFFFVAINNWQGGVSATYFGTQNRSAGPVYNGNSAGQPILLTLGHGAYTNGTVRAPGCTFVRKDLIKTYGEAAVTYANKLCEQSDLVNWSDPAVTDDPTTTKVPLFRRHGYKDQTPAVAGQANSSVEIRSAKFYENDMLVRDFVPVLLDGVGVMYDRCACKVYPNLGSGQFVCGAVDGVVPTEIAVVSASKLFGADAGVRLSVLQPDGATVSVSAVCDPASPTSTYEEGTSVTVTPVLGAGWAGTFHHWEGNVPAGHEFDNPLTVTMDRALRLHPIFATDGWTYDSMAKTLTDGYWTLEVKSETNGGLLVGAPTHPGVCGFLDLSKPINGGDDYFVSAVSGRSFYENQTLRELRVSDRLTAFSTESFAECHSLTNVTPFMPAALTVMYDSAFLHCYNLRGDLKLGTNGTAVALYETEFAMDPIDSLVMGPNVTTFGRYCFSACTNMTNCVLSAALTSIPEGAFYACSRLTKVELPDSVKSIGVEAFSACTELTDVRLPSELETLGDKVFRGDAKLRSVTPLLPATLRGLGIGVFSGALALEGEIALGLDLPPETTLPVGATAFWGTSVTRAEFGPGVTWGADGAQFEECKTIRKIVFHRPATTLPVRFLKNATALEDLVFYGLPTWTPSKDAQLRSWTGWGDGQVRLFLPREDASSVAFMANLANVTRWSELDDGVRDVYYARFGAGAKQPYGKTVASPETSFPPNQWVIRWTSNPKPGIMVLVY